jgi:hypothetical protein
LLRLKTGGDCGVSFKPDLPDTEASAGKRKAGFSEPRDPGSREYGFLIALLAGRAFSRLTERPASVIRI